MPDGPIHWSQAREVVVIALMVGALIGVSSGLLQAVNANNTALRFRILEFGQQMNTVNGLTMVLAAVLLVSGRAGVIRVGVRVAMLRINTLLAVAAAFCLITVLGLDEGIGDRLVAVTRSSAPAVLLFALAAWMSRMVLPDPARSTDP